LPGELKPLHSLLSSRRRDIADELTNLEQLLERIDRAAADREKISLGMIVESIGSRSFGPLLLMAGLILFSPISGIPGVPTLMGLLVLLIAGQLLFHRRHFWLPQWLLKFSLSKKKLCKALLWLKKPARFIDRWLRPRLCFLITGASTHIIAALCAVLAIAMPVMELVPFSATTVGAALTAFGLSLIAHDGVLALVAFVFTASTGGLVIITLVG
jgi:hypothetical protein